MNDSVAVEKCISLTSRDFIAESYAKDGTELHVAPRYNVEQDVRNWWREHREDHDRHVFLPKEHNATTLVCHDEEEAHALITQLQQELNRSLV